MKGTVRQRDFSPRPRIHSREAEQQLERQHNSREHDAEASGADTEARGADAEAREVDAVP